MVGNFDPVTAAPAGTAAPSVSDKRSRHSEARATGGSPLPSTGTNSPHSGNSADAIDMREAVERLSRLAKEAGRTLTFSIDQPSGRTVITVSNAQTGELVRQIPSEEVVRIARAFGNLGALIDDEA